jgi:hypothetical protein
MPTKKEKPQMSKPTNVLILTALLAGAVSAQTPSRFHLDSSDAAYWGGVGIGTGITAANPKHIFQLAPVPGHPSQFFVHDSGSYSLGRPLLIRAGIWGGIEAFQFAKPNHRRLFYWSKMALGATFAAIGAFRDKNQSRWIGPTSVSPIIP